MSFETYLLRGFEHPHENEMFEVLVKTLQPRFDSLPGRHVLIGNVMFDGNDLDVLFLKSTGICVLEMKAYGGKVLFRENTPWLVGDREVIGGSRENPFLQVRAYRYGLKQFLRGHASEIVAPPREVGWDHISALVVFRYPIDFEDRMLNGLRSWFGITDMEHVVERLLAVGSSQWNLSVVEIGNFLKILGIDERYRYSEESSQPQPQAEAPAAPAARCHLLYLKELGFRDHERRMRLRGGARSQGAQKIRELLEAVRKGLTPLSELPKRADQRVAGAAVYEINSVTQFIVIHNGTAMFPAFLGDTTEVEGWLDAHRGLVVTIDSDNGRINVTRMADLGGDSELQPPALSTTGQPLLQQLDGLVLEELVPARRIREGLLEIIESTTDEDIRDTLEMVSDTDIRSFLFDLINLLRSGDQAGAKARLGLRLGQSVPIQDAGASVEAAATSAANSDQVLLINALSKEDLERLLDPKHFQDWMLFLHPDQKTLADAEFDRPVVLTGVSGSGKTCILVHRARYLARKYPGERIGILTLSRSLAGLLQNLVNALLTEQERKCVLVTTFYDVFRKCLEHLGPEKYFAQLASQVHEGSHLHTVLAQAKRNWPKGMVWNCDPIRKDRVDEQWEWFYMSQNPDLKEWMDGLVKYFEEYRIDASRYLEEEFMLIRSQFPVPNRMGYLATDEKNVRAGRAIPLRKELRQEALRLLLFWEEWLLAGGMIDDLGLTQALMPLHTQMQSLPEALQFRSLLVDEFQDFSTLDLQLFRRVVPIQQPDSLFLTGDTVQKILVKRHSLRDAHLDRGPAIHKAISKNYRNSKQVLLAASRLPAHYASMAQSQGEEMEVLNPELALRETNPPIVLKTSDEIFKAWEIVLECTRDNKAEPWTVCIATASKDISVEDILKKRPKELAARPLSGDCMLHPEEIVVGKMNDLKGFEFRLILILGCNAEAFPEKGVPAGEVWRDALRLYVAMTRGRDQVYLLYSANPSEFLTVMGDTVLRRDEPLLSKYELAVPVTVSAPSGPQVTPARIIPADWDEICEDWFTVAECDVLHRYFAKYIYRDGLTFREWLRPKSLDLIQTNKLVSLPKSNPIDVADLVNTLRGKGLNLAPLPPGFPPQPPPVSMKPVVTKPVVTKPHGHQRVTQTNGMHKCATPGCQVQISVRKTYCKRCRISKRVGI